MGYEAVLFCCCANIRLVVASASAKHSQDSESDVLPRGQNHLRLTLLQTSLALLGAVLPYRFASDILL